MKRILITLILTLCCGVMVKADNNPQTLPFTQDWTNIGLITTNDDWNGVPGITAFQGNDLTTIIGADPRFVIADGSTTTLDIIANVANCDTNASGGIAECEQAGGNPVVALQGSGTADVAHLLIKINTTGQSKIRVRYNVRDVDGSADNALQQVALQYRVGNTGNFIGIPAGFVFDATTGPSQATQVTAVDATLPAAANNQPLVEIRVSTVNAPGSDEWVGIDDINITANSPNAYPSATTDFDGDGRSDYAVARPISGSFQWNIQQNGNGTFSGANFGLATDFLLPEDYDGDGKDDIATWRSGPAGTAAYYIFNSSTNSVNVQLFGQTGDDPTVVRDYDGDGRADIAVFRCPPTSPVGTQCFWYYRGTLNNPSGATTFMPWGAVLSGSRDFPAPGDYDGDGKGDFVISRNGIYYQRLSSNLATPVIIPFGNSSDMIVGGDFDGDRKTDLAVARGAFTAGSPITWLIQYSGGGGVEVNWGIGQDIVAGRLTGDTVTPGDYNGDGRTDPAVWRGSTSGDQNFFYVLPNGPNNIAFGTLIAQEWGQCPTNADCDYPVANYQTH